MNSALVLLYWQVGRRIRTEVLQEQRAGYGEEILSTLSKELVAEYGGRFSVPNLSRMIRFAELFPEPEIVATLSKQLGWSHFVELIPMKEQLRREFYAEMCRLERWSVRDIERFILELGAGFVFVARQKRIVIDGDDFYIDLLFYPRKLRRLVAIDLKLEKFKAADKGQMELYLRWLEKHETEEGEGTPLGLILCADKGDEQVELLQLDKSGIRVATYLTQLPPKAVLQKRLHAAAQLARDKLTKPGE